VGRDLTVIHDLVSSEQRDQAKALLTLVFGGRPRVTRDHCLFGIYEWGELVAVTGVHWEHLDKWHRETAYAQDFPEPPEAAIAFTAVHPDYRQKGHATTLRRHLQGIYRSLVTGTGPKSNREAMHRLNERTGFRVLWQRGKTTVWYWERPGVG